MAHVKWSVHPHPQEFEVELSSISDPAFLFKVSDALGRVLRSCTSLRVLKLTGGREAAGSSPRLALHWPLWLCWVPEASWSCCSRVRPGDFGVGVPALQASCNSMAQNASK